jgi:alkanesulfonate monooxygenase SsuD/methylene tetrahydromethanopterin reductase-like flavin-dependent oxidoreductase (luciferase family)
LGDSPEHSTKWPAFAAPFEPLTGQALAQVTTRIKVGPWIANIYLRHPALCAQTAVTIADTSHGRLLLGLGMSHGPIVQGVYKSKFENPRDYFREYVSAREDRAGESCP